MNQQIKKKSKRFSVYLLIVVLLLVSLGYAILHTTLNIAGTASLANASWDIHFENVQVTPGSVEATTAATITNPTTVTYSIMLNKPGDYYEFTVDAVNAGTIDGMISNVSSKLNNVEITNLPNYLEYELKYANGVKILTNHLLAANSSETYKVRVGYNKEINPSDLPEEDQSLSFTFEVTYIQADSNAKEVTVPTIKTSYSEDKTAFRSDTYREKIKTITLSDEISPPENVIESWDVGVNQNGNVMAYVTTNSDDNMMYDLYIQGDGVLYANQDSSYLFYNLKSVDSIAGMNNLNISQVTNMHAMFYNTGYNSTTFNLDLGDNFDTTHVTNMSQMFYNTGYGSTSFTLDLGDKFDTSQVTRMSYMFFGTGYSSTSFTLDLGDKFDTSQVTHMNHMFTNTGYSSLIFTLDLSDKFDTSHVTDMQHMFSNTGQNSPVFTLNLRSKFDTSRVTNMNSMFMSTGFRSQEFTLDLGDKFDTSRVTSMQQMFFGTGHFSPIFTLNLRNKFDTSNVTNMKNMFYNLGYTNPTFTLDLGDKFDTSKVTNMYGMFYQTGYSSTSFTLDLGDKFDTSQVTDMSWMFYSVGFYNNSLDLDLSTFDFDSVTNYGNIFGGLKTTQKIYVKDAVAQSWIINNSGNSNLTTANVIIKT